MFWHEYAKIPRHTSKNAITVGDGIFARNCEGTEQLRRLEITDCTTENKKRVRQLQAKETVRKTEIVSGQSLLLLFRTESSIVIIAMHLCTCTER